MTQERADEILKQYITKDELHNMIECFGRCEEFLVYILRERIFLENKCEGLSDDEIEEIETYLHQMKVSNVEGDPFHTIVTAGWKLEGLKTKFYDIYKRLYQEW